MDSGIIRAVTVVTAALISYSIGVITEQRKKAVLAAPAPPRPDRPKNLNRYTRFACGWWGMAYIVGAIVNAILAWMPLQPAGPGGHSFRGVQHEVS